MKPKSRLSAAKIIALGFAALIAVGTLLLSMPFSHSGKVRVTPLDALFSSVSAVCVTGLITVDTGAAYSAVGQTVIAVLLQIGGLGVTSVSAGVASLAGKKLSRRENTLIREALNYPTYNGLGDMIRSVVILDLSLEAVGALLSFPAFAKLYPAKKAALYAVFHSVAAFNNGGFDILGNGDSVGVFAGDPYFNIVTSLIIIAGGLGFFVIRELLMRVKPLAAVQKPSRLSLHSRVVIMLTSFLIVFGTLLVKLTEGGNITWLGAFFASVTARTAGFATFPLGGFSNAGILVMCLLMFVGASPGSTGGGVKTTTAFVFVKRLISVATGREAVVAGRKIKDEALGKAYIIISLAFSWIAAVTVILTFLEPDIPLRDILFETVSGFSTTGLTTGITPTLSVPSKLILVLTMYVGRLGPLTVATLWSASGKSGVSRPEGELPIG